MTTKQHTLAVLKEVLAIHQSLKEQEHKRTGLVDKLVPLDEKIQSLIEKLRI